MKAFGWGGARPGAGRPKTSELVSHIERPRVGKQRPILITLKVRSAAEGLLRTPEFLDVFEKATLRARRFGLRIIHFSFLPKKILMLVEVKTQEELEKSFKSLNTALAIVLKKKVREATGIEHRGPIFLGRFEMKILQNGEETREALRKIFLSYPQMISRQAYPDEYSTAGIFGAWKEILEPIELAQFQDFESSSEEVERLKRITATPQFWLSQSGWRRAAVAPADLDADTNPAN